MSSGLLSLSKIAVFAVVTIFVTNLSRVILGSRIGIVPYQVEITGSVIFVAFAIFNGNFFRLSKPPIAVLMWLGTIMAVMLLSLLLVSSNALAYQTFTNFSRFVLMAASFTLLMQNRELLPAAMYGVLAATILSMVVTYMEFTNPEFRIVRDVRYITDADRIYARRIAGLHVDPNANATLMVLALFLVQYILPRSLRFIFALTVGAAVLVTASRGSLVLWLIVVGWSFWAGVYVKGQVIPKIIALGTVTAFTLALTTGQVPIILSSLGLDEYMNSQMLERLSSGFFSQGDSSADARLTAIEENLELFFNHPITGTGLGNSLSYNVTVGSHNMLLRMASELGIFGVLSYLSLLLVPIIARSKEGFMFVVFFYISNMFTHTAFTKSTFAILVPLAVLYFAANAIPANSRHKRRRRKTRTKQISSPA